MLKGSWRGAESFASRRLRCGRLVIWGLGGVCLLAAVLVALQPATGVGGDIGRTGGTVIEATTITTDTVWTAAASPYEIEGAVFVQSPATLTIDKGVRVLLKGSGSIYYFTGGIMGGGNLVIRGTADARVKVESPVPAGPGALPPLGIRVGGTQSVMYADLVNISIAGCTPKIDCPSPLPEVSFDRVNFQGTFFRFQAAYVRLTNSTVSRSYGVQTLQRADIVGNLIWLGQTVPGLPIGVYPNLGALAVNSGTVMSNSIIYNSNGGVHGDLASGTNITVTANNIYGNGGWDFAAMNQASGGPPRAPNNWWGTTDVAAIQARIVGIGSYPPALDFLPVATAPIPGAPMPLTAYLPWVTVGASGW